MKASLWLFTLALAIMSSACWCVAQVLIISWQHKSPDAPLPYFTQLVFYPHGWLLFCPLPWIVYAALLSLKKQLAPGDVCLFASTICVAVSAIVSATAIAGLLPHLDLIAIL
jgi:hypothetical protein